MKLDISWRDQAGDKAFNYHLTMPNWVLVTGAALLSASWITYRALAGRKS